MLYQVHYGQSFTGHTTAMTYVEADSYAQAFAQANGNACGREVVQRLYELPNPSTQQQ